MSRPVRRIKLHEQVARDLSVKIMRRDLEPRSLLPNEEELCRMFDVSRTVIREAIRFMEAKGLVEVRPRIGTRICEPAKWILTDSKLMQWRIESDPEISLIEDLVELRSLIEPMAAGMAADRATEEQIDAMFAALEGMYNADSIEAQIEADIVFHLSILEACGNELMISALRPVIVSTLGPTFNRFMQNIDDAKQSVPVHEKIIQAIKARNRDAAMEAMRYSILYGAKDFQKVEQAKKAC